MDLLTLVQVLENGRRLEKPLNTACSDTMYVDSVEISYPVTTCQMHIGMFVCLVKVSSNPLSKIRPPCTYFESTGIFTKILQGTDSTLTCVKFSCILWKLSENLLALSSDLIHYLGTY